VVAELLRLHGHDHLLDQLTARERDILGLMAQGWSNKAICEQLKVSPKTVETHVGSIFAKLGLLPADEHHRRVLAVLANLRVPPP
jgi:DNA-binding NarL/FixJ family response regulator